ncbi:MAG: hypothetical protein KDH15_20355 [Rhodocyclaceae bacterium]|nr:hypothetical protein [Rhodocyclaceae bacterium]
MNGDATSTALQALLALVATDRERRCAQALAPAEAEARSTFRRAAHALRREHREALSRQRAEHEARLAKARARVATAEHARQLRRVAMIADEAWPLLASALTDRWRKPPARRRWIASATNAALARLPARGWIVRHPPDLPERERVAMVADLAKRGITEVRCDSAEEIGAGIEIRAGETRLDATVDGLTSDRQAIVGRLIHLWTSA